MPAKSKYTAGFKAEFPELVRRLALLGATDAQMAKVCGVALSTFSNWKVERPEFAAAMDEAKVIADANVVNALYHRAIGYEHDDVDIRVIKGKIVKTTIRKYYPPDTGANIFWLKNRQGWRDKVETGVTDNEGKDVAQVDPLELARRVAFLLHKGAQG